MFCPSHASSILGLFELYKVLRLSSVDFVWVLIMYNKIGGFGGSASSSGDVLNCISDAFCVNPIMYYVM